MNLHSIDLWLVALLLTVALWTAFGMFSRWCAFSPAVPQERMEKLTVGMSLDDVTSLLGQPRATHRGGEGMVSMIYGSRLKRQMLIVEFNRAGRVEQFAHGIPDKHRADFSDNP